MILWNLVPEKYRSGAFIAGGYAACPSLASDCDLWIHIDSYLGGPTLAEAREEVLTHIRGMDVSITEQDDTKTTKYAGVNVNILEVGYIPGPKRVHVMVVDAPVNAVLEGFDVSTHQVALLSNGQVFLGSQWTPVNEDPVKLIDTPHTAERMEKIRNRYGRQALAEA